ncbi:hypothetical protein [Shewanella phage FishSpeaker]|nr:hypothetical protein [Shewanella phage FishSpeaker]
MDIFFLWLCVFSTTLYFFGIFKRQLMFIKHRIQFDVWHVMFCLSTIPMMMSVIPFIDLLSGRIYTLWVVPLAFHMANMADLKSRFNKERK